MRLKALDQIQVTNVQPDALRPGQEFEINDADGAQLLKRHPTIFERLDGGQKARRSPPNKAAPPLANRADQ